VDLPAARLEWSVAQALALSAAQLWAVAPWAL
jgi:hypothetical protein